MIIDELRAPTPPDAPAVPDVSDFIDDMVAAGVCQPTPFGSHARFVFGFVGFPSFFWVQLEDKRALEPSHPATHFTSIYPANATSFTRTGSVALEPSSPIYPNSDHLRSVAQKRD